MNLLENKDVLRSLLLQGDQLNTLAGGVSKIGFNIEKRTDGFLIEVNAPGIEADQLKVISDKNSLQVLAALNHPGLDQGVMIPLFYRKVELPIFANTDDVEAVHHENKLEIFVPIGKNSSSSKKEIEIKQL
jgi:HSP20 family protein